MSRVTSVRLISVGGLHLFTAALLITQGAAGNKVWLSVIGFAVIEMIDMHIIPGNHDSAPMAAERPIAMMLMVDDAMLIGSVTVTA